MHYINWHSSPQPTMDENRTDMGGQARPRYNNCGWLLAIRPTDAGVTMVLRRPLCAWTLVLSSITNNVALSKTDNYTIAGGFDSRSAGLTSYYHNRFESQDGFVLTEGITSRQISYRIAIGITIEKQRPFRLKRVCV